MIGEGAWTWIDTDSPTLKLGISRASNRERLRQLVDEAFDHVLTPEVAKGRTFVVKPNLGFPTDERGGTTSSTLLEATLDKIRRDCAPSGIHVVESDGIAFRCEQVFEYLGLPSLCAGYQASLLNLSRLPRSRVRFPSSRVLKEIELPELLVRNSPLLINLAKIKTHEIAMFSGAVKNLYGMNPYVFKIRYHPVINDALSDVYHIFRPALTIVDGSWAVNGHGPWNGRPERLGIVIASSDALLADLAALRTIGWKSSSVPYVARLAQGYANVEQTIERLVPAPETPFHWVPASKATLLRERMARLIVPLLELGMPLVFPSGKHFKMVSYGERGTYCRSISTLGNWREDSAG